jgi:hypothetical protein
MAGPGVTVNVQDGNLGLQPGSNQNVLCLMGCSLGGTINTIYNFGDVVTAQNTLIGGELLEAVVYALKAAPGSTVQAVPLNPGTRGGVGAVTKTGAGAETVTPSIAPWGAITITVVTGGALGTAVFTFGVTNPVTGVTTTTAPITSAASWSSTGVIIPNTFTTWVATAGTYVAGGTPDIYSISAAGVITHPQGTGPVIGTQSSSPLDFYRPLITFTLGGALGTSQFTYSLDNGGSTSAIVTTPGSGVYAIPGTGIVLTIAGTATAGDTHTFSAAGPTFTNTDLNSALTQLETTLLNSFQSSMVALVGSQASAAAWATQVATCETAALAFNGLNVYPRFFVGGPTVGTVLQNAGSITVDAADTDTVVIAARAGMSAPHVCVAAGDGYMLSPATGLSFRRNSVWAAFGRALAVAASEDIGWPGRGGVTAFTSCVRDDFANASSFYTAGITSLRTFGSGTPVMLNRGLMGTTSTSDFYILTNARVIDIASVIAVANSKIYILAKLPTQTRAGTAGTIREDAAKKIEAKVSGGLQAAMVNSSPQNAVAATCVVTRTNNIFSSGQLILTVAVQPYAYAPFVVANIGMTLQAS